MSLGSLTEKDIKGAIDEAEAEAAAACAARTARARAVVSRVHLRTVDASFFEFLPTCAFFPT